MPDACECLSDLDGSGGGDLLDLAQLRSAFGRDAGGDVDADGDSDIEDLGLLLADFGTAGP